MWAFDFFLNLGRGAKGWKEEKHWKAILKKMMKVDVTVTWESQEREEN